MQSPQFPLTHPHVTWLPADHDVYVAHAAGEYAGFIAVDPDTFVANDALGRALGTHPDLASAKRAVEDVAGDRTHVGHHSRRAGGRRVRRGPRRRLDAATADAV